MALSSHLTVIKMAGTATVFTDAATTSLGSNRYQIADATKSVFSPDYAVSVKDGASTVAATAYSVDYLFGTVTLNSAPTGAVTITGRYVPLLEVVECRSADITCTRSEFPLNYAGTSYVDLAVGRMSASVAIDSTRIPADSVDAAGTLADDWEAIQDQGLPKLLEVNLGGSGRYFRCWGVLPGLPMSAPEDGVISGAREFKSVIRRATGRSELVSFGFGT